MKIDYTFVQAFERSKDSGTRRTSARAFTVLLMAVFFIALMGGLAGGAIMYQKISSVQATNNNIHLQAGLIANTVHVNDAYDAVQSGEGPEGPALVLVESIESGNYETRLYLYQGHIMQEYAIAGRPYNPLTATALFESSSFGFSMEGKILTITTDRGSCDVTLRCKQEGLT